MPPPAIEGVDPIPVDCAVLIVTYNSAAYVGDLLDSLPAAAGGLSLRTVVVDNRSTDGTVALVRGRPEVQCIEAGANLGYAGAINLARRHAGPCACVLVLNPDLVLEAGAIARLAATLRDPSVGVAVPMILDLEWQAGAHGPPRAVAEQGDRRCRIRPPPAESAGLVERDGPRRARVPLSAPGGLGGRRGGDHLCGVRRRGRSVGRALLPLLRGGRLRGPCACCRFPHRVCTDRTGSTPRRGVRVLPGARCAAGGEPDSVRREAWPGQRRLPGRGGAPRVAARLRPGPPVRPSDRASPVEPGQRCPADRARRPSLDPFRPTVRGTMLDPLPLGADPASYAAPA